MKFTRRNTYRQLQQQGITRVFTEVMVYLESLDSKEECADNTADFDGAKGAVKGRESWWA
jgi:hypothetical protein